MAMKNGDDFVKFLKDENFIEWKLLPSEQNERYWNEFLSNHPEEEANIILAEKHLQHFCNQGSELSKTKKDEYLKHLDQSINRYSRKKRIHRIIYIAAACFTLLLISVLFYNLERNNSESELAFSPDYIVGSELESQDILFTTGNNTTSFNENIEIEILSGNNARIKSDNIKASDITIAENSINKLVVPYGKQSKLELPDGTKVWLNSGSVLEFPTDFDSKTVKVKLSGEMYVEVAPDKKRTFMVQTSDFDVRVFGTKFNVSSYDGSLPSVVLVEGSVGLSTGKNSEITMQPSELAVLTEQGVFNKKSVDTNLFTSWKEGYLTFSETPMPEALKQIERFYNLSFNFDDNISFTGHSCTGKIILSDNLDNVLTALSLISSTNYMRENNSIYIYKNN